MVLGVFVAYIGNAIFVFRVPLSWRGLLQYPLIYICQYLVGLLLLVGEVSLLGMNERLVPLLNVAIMVPLTYLMNRLMLFKGSQND